MRCRPPVFQQVDRGSRFPQFVEGFALRVVDYVADVVKVSAEEWERYDLSYGSAKGHHTRIREAVRFRPATRADEERPIGWLTDEVCPVELAEDGCARPCSCSAAATASSPRCASSGSRPPCGPSGSVCGWCLSWGLRGKADPYD